MDQLDKQHEYEVTLGDGRHEAYERLLHDVTDEMEWRNEFTQIVCTWMGRDDESARRWFSEAKRHRQEARACPLVYRGMRSRRVAAWLAMRSQLEAEVFEPAGQPESPFYRELLAAAAKEVHWGQIAEHWLRNSKIDPIPA